MIVRGSSKIPGLAQLCQLYHHLLSDPDLHCPPDPGRRAYLS